MVAEDQGKPGEEKLEFTREGEAFGYISLDQARVLAMRTARENPGAYGRRYLTRPMAFDVVEGSETEDHYINTLSFRPQGAFNGTPGQEQFFIEKEGVVAHRQVLNLPVVAGGRRSRVIAVAVGLLAVAIAVVIGTTFLPEDSGEGDRSVSSPTVTLVEPAESTATLASDSVPTATGSIGLTRGGTISGRVYEADGRTPVNDVTVMLRTSEPKLGQMARTPTRTAATR